MREVGGRRSPAVAKHTASRATPSILLVSGILLSTPIPSKVPQKSRSLIHLNPEPDPVPSTAVLHTCTRHPPGGWLPHLA